jgi:hypothetical protein
MRCAHVVMRSCEQTLGAAQRALEAQQRTVLAELEQARVRTAHCLT